MVEQSSTDLANNLQDMGEKLWIAAYATYQKIILTNKSLPLKKVINDSNELQNLLSFTLAQEFENFDVKYYEKNT